MRRTAGLISFFCAGLLLLLLLSSPKGGGGVVVAPPIPGVKAILIIEDKPGRYKIPPKQLSILSAGDVSDFAKANGFEFKTWDVRVQAAPGPLKTAFDKLVRQNGDQFQLAEGVKLPWLLISNDPAKKGYNGALPGDLPAMNALLERMK